MIKIIKEKTIALTGHRRLYPDISIEKIKEVFLREIENEFDTFLIGMAVGFDILCFEILESIRLEKDIKLIACIPCENQNKKFSIEQSIEYLRAVKSADERIFLSKEYTPYCMMKRNMFMVDNCSKLVCYLRDNKGGTFNTVKYAKEKGVQIIKV